MSVDRAPRGQLACGNDVDDRAGSLAVMAGSGLSAKAGPIETPSPPGGTHGSLPPKLPIHLRGVHHAIPDDKGADAGMRVPIVTPAGAPVIDHTKPGQAEL